jgi:hypothetical protein
MIALACRLESLARLPVQGYNLSNHMAEIHGAFKDMRVTLNGFTAMDPNKTESKVTEMVKKRGPKLKDTFAYIEQRVKSLEEMNEKK